MKANLRSSPLSSSPEANLDGVTVSFSDLRAQEQFRAFRTTALQRAEKLRRNGSVNQAAVVSAYVARYDAPERG